MDRHPPTANLRIVALVPARYASSRFPGKPLARIAGKPMIQHVVERTRRVAGVDEVIVATDDARIEAAVRAFGGAVVQTRPDHPTGTDRIAEVAAGLSCDIVVNVQGDVPFVRAEMIRGALAPLVADPSLPMATIAVPLREAAEGANPNVVKVVTDREGNALYFSRFAIPFVRDATGDRSLHRKHVGLYAYRRDFLLLFPTLAPTPLERAESLEQLRALEHGYRIRVTTVESSSVEVDTPADLERAEAAALLEGDVQCND
jgi:3-deoxy-manno-octulosonate cytidylyltransferase (CMP-KDO synthetase)